ncbi:hypothetical protein BDA99DRAFT_8405 [Phascolomyces articulosus]|uniref:Uncharacterized protein n=1 Tax=Phascolomyces articulosus TaxID=60185 RepID=A0AAD5KC74_9FUNG|nr:hypothetical protein BDA99DRAFT_8405 [Phascolomyces articulosus]
MVDITDLLMSFRTRSIKTASRKKQLDNAQMLSLNFIFLLNNEQKKSATVNMDRDTHNYIVQNFVNVMARTNRITIPDQAKLWAYKRMDRVRSTIKLK